MRDGWETRKLGELCSSTPSANPQNSPSTEFTYVDVSSVSNRTFRIEETQRLLGSDAPSRARRQIKADDVLFATIRPTLQRIAVVPPELDGAVCSTGYIVLRARKGLLHPKYLFHWLFSQQFSEAMAALQKGASYPAVTESDVRGQSIPVPPLAEQERIVRILDEALDGIATARAHAESNLTNANLLLQSEINRVVDQCRLLWPLVPLSSQMESIADGDHMPPPKSTSGIPFITISNINKDLGEIDFSETFSVGNDYFNRLTASRRPRSGDILYTVTGWSLGIPVLVQSNRDFCFQRHIALLRPSDSKSSRWLLYVLRSSFVYGQASDGATGAAQKTVGLKTLRNLQVPAVPPSVRELAQLRLRAIELSCFELRSRLLQKTRELDLLRSALLRRAFSGVL